MILRSPHGLGGGNNEWKGVGGQNVRTFAGIVILSEVDMESMNNICIC